MPIYPAHKLSIIRKAARAIRRGALVAFPTETVYGLGADAMNARAVARIFAAKSRPKFDPLIVHVAHWRQTHQLWADAPYLAKRLADRFWPGPLTIVYAKQRTVPDIVTAGLDTVGVRMPDHPVALRLIREAGTPIAAPSANPFGRTSPTTADAVAEDLGSRAGMILDGGKCRIGVESTVVWLDKDGVTLLRPGGVPVDAIRRICPVRAYHGKSGRSARVGPGLLKSHYAPRTKMVLVPRLSKSLERMLTRKYPGRAIAYLRLSRRGRFQQAAAELFESLRKLDKMKPDLILAETFPAKGMGPAIMDRLTKASAGRRGIRQAFKILKKGKHKWR